MYSMKNRPSYLKAVWPWLVCLAFLNLGDFIQPAESYPTIDSDHFPTAIRSDTVLNNSKETASDTFKFDLIALLPQNDGTFKSTKLVENGKVLAVKCAQNSANTELGSCLNISMYADRTSFEFKFDESDAKNISISKPVVSSSMPGLVKPEILGYSISKRELMRTFEVRYHCNGNASTTIQMSMQIANKNVTVSWGKKCGVGFNQYVSLTSKELQSGTELNDSNLKLLQEVGPMETSTSIELKTQFPQVSADFLAPYLVSENKDIGARLRGTVTGGTAGLSPTKIKVIYQCQTASKGNLKLTVAVPPWNNVTVSWTKNCGGQDPTNLVIMNGKKAVWDNIGLHRQFAVSENSTVDSSENAGVLEVDSEQHYLDFGITNMGSDNMKIESPILTVKQGNVLAVRTDDSWSLFEGARITEGNREEVVLAPKKKVNLRLHLVCLKRGTVVVLVTLGVLRYKHVEFGFVKECTRPHVYHHSGFMRTAGSLEIFSFVVLAGIIYAAYRMYRTRATNTTKYAQVQASG